MLLTFSLVACGGEMTVALVRRIVARTTRTGRLRRQLDRLEAAGTIVMSGGGTLDQRLLRLTSNARLNLLGGIDPVEEWERPWDGVWRIVAFDVPESATALRTRLRRRLRKHRFGWLQNSVWISPRPVDDFRRAVGDLDINPESLTYFEARAAGGESPSALVSGAWDFPRLAKDYEGYRQILRLRPGRYTGTIGDWLQWIGAEHRAWRRIARRDPFLPAVLLPSSYAGQMAWRERREAFGAFARAIEACR